MKTCERCGQPMSDTAEGLCPRCLMSAAVKSDAPEAITRKLTSTPEWPDIADAAEIARRLPQFEILALLGRGGMGVVYKARQRELDRVVALKILPPADALSPDFVERFRREARSLAKLSHPNIVHVYDFGEAGGLHYLVMEFVDGVNLRDAMRAGKITPPEALAVVPKICDALQYAHEEGVVHRDIKPENILIDRRGRVKIADFGLAKLLRRDASDATLTQSGMTLGTPRYMAPEQLDKPETVDHRADIYSLGVVFYEMLTGEVPMGRFAPPSAKVQVDVKLDEIVLRSLERDVERRYQHASEVKTDVESVAGKAAMKPSQDAAKSPSRFRWVFIVFVALAVGVMSFLFGVPLVRYLSKMRAPQELRIERDDSQIPTARTPGRHDYAFIFTAPPNHRVLAWIEWWKDGKVTVDQKFNYGQAMPRGEALVAKLHMTMSDGDVASPATAGQIRIDWNFHGASLGRWMPDPFAGAKAQTAPSQLPDKLQPRAGEAVTLLILTGTTGDSLPAGMASEEKLRAGQPEIGLVLKARFDTVPESRLNEGSYSQTNAHRPAEGEPSAALLRLEEQFGDKHGPFVTAEDIRAQLRSRFKRSAEDRAKAEQMLRDRGAAPAADATPEDLVKALENSP